MFRQRCTCVSSSQRWRSQHTDKRTKDLSDQSLSDGVRHVVASKSTKDHIVATLARFAACDHSSERDHAMVNEMWTESFSYLVVELCDRIAEPQDLGAHTLFIQTHEYRKTWNTVLRHILTLRLCRLQMSVYAGISC